MCLLSCALEQATPHSWASALSALSEWSIWKQIPRSGGEACRGHAVLKSSRHPIANMSSKYYSVPQPLCCHSISNINHTNWSSWKKITINLLLCQLSSCTLNISTSDIKKKINLLFPHDNYCFKCYFLSALEFLVFFCLVSSQVMI